MVKEWGLLKKAFKRYAYLIEKKTDITETHDPNVVGQKYLYTIEISYYLWNAFIITLMLSP